MRKCFPLLILHSVLHRRFALTSVFSIEPLWRQYLSQHSRTTEHQAGSQSHAEGNYVVLLIISGVLWMAVKQGFPGMKITNGCYITHLTICHDAHSQASSLQQPTLQLSKALIHWSHVPTSKVSVCLWLWRRSFAMGGNTAGTSNTWHGSCRVCGLTHWRTVAPDKMWGTLERCLAVTDGLNWPAKLRWYDDVWRVICAAALQRDTAPLCFCFFGRRDSLSVGGSIFQRRETFRLQTNLAHSSLGIDSEGIYWQPRSHFHFSMTSAPLLPGGLCCTQTVCRLEWQCLCFLLNVKHFLLE